MNQSLTFEIGFPDDNMWAKHTWSLIKNAMRKLGFKDVVSWICAVPGYAEALVNVVCTNHIIVI